MSNRVLVLSTLETKADEIRFLRTCLDDHGIENELVDLSLWSHGDVWDGRSKIEAMNSTAARAVEEMKARLSSVDCLVGLGGGTGGEIIMRAMGAMPITFPKLLITTLPFDPRMAVADNSIVLVPTLADICGLNATLRQVLENAAAMTAGLCRSRRKEGACVEVPSVGITALGATEAAVGRLIVSLKDRGQEATVFHANGYGGAAYARFIARGAFRSVVDLTTHELTRLLIAGSHADMPARFLAATDAGLPQVVLPGGLNFIGLGQIDLVPPAFLERPHYRHSSYFTHVKLREDEMAGVAEALVTALNKAPGRPHLIVPMGGFSHQDAPGGAIEDPDLRGIFLSTARRIAAPHVTVETVDAHISAPATTTAILAALDSASAAIKDRAHA
ncbi:MAG: Tm-1-like ATP-binding domain-containing protein [Roseibium sp.]|nr:Tm-1-like ATP-binding domain-containing protein [Roseibium sp.]